MKLTIDTKEDSADEIRKVIHLLNMIIEGKTGSSESNYGSNSVPSVGNFFDMPTANNTTNNASSTTNDDTSLGLELVGSLNKEDLDKDEVNEDDKIIIY